MSKEGQDPVIVDPKIETPPPAAIDPKDHQRLLEDIKKEKEARKKLEDQLKENQKQQDVEKQNFKKLWEESETERKKDAHEKEQLRLSIANKEKYSAVKDEASKLGLRNEVIEVGDLDLLSLDEVAVDTESGKWTVKGAKEYAEKLKAQRPHWFGSPTPPPINTNAPGAKSTTPKTFSDEIKAAKTQAELDAVLKKYGKA